MDYYNTNGLNAEDAREWISWQPGQRERFELRLNTQRIGQAWFNSLRFEDAEKLRGGRVDPFYKDSWPDVIQALAFLLDN